MRRRFLPGLVSGRDRWCQGFSEPDAGSDLASLRTRAVPDGSEYVITGHKVWTSYSDQAEWCLVLARTDHDVPRHKGISAFAVPMDQPGIEQRPLPMINGVTREFGEVIFDGARVPAANMIGAPGEGWPLAMTVVSHEREPGELGFVSRYRKTGKDLVKQVKADPGRIDQHLQVGFRRHVGSEYGVSYFDREADLHLSGEPLHLIHAPKHSTTDTMAVGSAAGMSAASVIGHTS